MTVKKRHLRIFGLPLAVVALGLFCYFLSLISPALYAAMIAALGADVGRFAQTFSNPYISIVFGIGGIVLMYFFEKMKNAQKRKFLKKPSDFANGSGSETGTHLGVIYEYSFRTNKYGFLTDFIIRIPTRSTGNYQLTSKKRAHEFLNSTFTFKRPILTGDFAFDRENYLFSDTTDYARTYFSISSNRDAARLVLNLGFSGIEISGGQLEARTGWTDTSYSPPTDLIASALPWLVELANAAPMQASEISRQRMQFSDQKDGLPRITIFPSTLPYAMAATIVVSSIVLTKAVDYWDEQLSIIVVGTFLSSAFWGLILAGLMKGCAKIFFKFEIATMPAYLAGFLMSAIPPLFLHFLFRIMHGEVDTYGLVTYMFGLFISAALVPVVLGLYFLNKFKRAN